MKISYDKEIDAQYIRIKAGKVAYTKPKNEWLIIDYNAKNEVIGIEVLDDSKHPVLVSTDGTDVTAIEIIEEPVISTVKTPDYTVVTRQGIPAQVIFA